MTIRWSADLDSLFGRAGLLSLWLLAAMPCNLQAQAPAMVPPSLPTAQSRCLPDGGGYLRARLAGAVRAELAWSNEGTECSGAARPAAAGGMRLRFSGRGPGPSAPLVLLFGITGLQEGQSGRNVPVNVTVIRDGLGEFYSTQGDDKCMLDEVIQQPLTGIPHRARAYKVIARGFCTGPARAVHGAAALLLSRFDFAGRVEYSDLPDSPPETVQTR